MKNIKVNHKFNESSRKTEEEKIKWFINTLVEEYSVQSVKMSINKINKIDKQIKEEAHDLVS